MLSSHLFLCLPCLLPPFTVPCKWVFARPDERETCPYHCSLHLFTMVRRSWRGPTASRQQQAAGSRPSQIRHEQKEEIKIKSQKFWFCSECPDSNISNFDKEAVGTSSVIWDASHCQEQLAVGQAYRAIFWPFSDFPSKLWGEVGDIISASAVAQRDELYNAVKVREFFFNRLWEHNEAMKKEAINVWQRLNGYWTVISLGILLRYHVNFVEAGCNY